MEGGEGDVPRIPSGLQLAAKIQREPASRGAGFPSGWNHPPATQSASTSPIRGIGGGLSRQRTAAGTPSGAEPLAEAKINKLLGLKVLIKKC